MITNVLIALSALACAQAAAVLGPAVTYGSPYGYAHGYPQQPALTTQHQNILRSPYNLGQVTTFSKTVDTPYSSVSKSDVRVSNPGYTTFGVAPSYHGYAAPAYHGYAAPAYHGYAAPAVSYAAPAYHGYAAPAVSYASPYVSHAVAPVAKVATGLLGVAYSAAPAVSHMTYNNGLGLAYSW